MILKGYIFGIAYALVCLLLSFILYKLGLPKKYTRKLVHILVGFEWMILYTFMGAGIHFLAVCVIFLILLTVAYKGKLMPMISSDADNAPGTVYYAAAMTGVATLGCFVPEVMLPFGIGVMCTSIGDGMAGVVGQLVKGKNPKIYGNKTLLGSATNFVMSALSAYVLSLVFSMEISVPNCLAIALLSAMLELITPYGLDNVSITWGATALAYSFMYIGAIYNYLAPILLTPLIIIFAVKKRALTIDGIIAAIILDAAVSLAFGNFGFLILSSFFVGSIIVDKIKKHNKKRSRNDGNDERDCRNYMQVLANGMVAFVVAIAFIVTGKRLFIIPFIASLTEAFSDTAASGMGAFSETTFDPFRWKKCENGLSGGMSVIGTLSSLFGSVLIASVAYAIGSFGFGLTDFYIVVASAFAGAVLDSALGSLLQVKYKCRECGKITEREEHCGVPTARYSGIRIIDNDIVNIISCSFSAVIATVLAVLL